MKKVKVIKAIKNKDQQWQIAYKQDDEDILINGLRNLLRLKVLNDNECYILYSTGEFPEVGLESISFLGSGVRKDGVNAALYEYIDKRTGPWTINVPFELLERDEVIPQKIYFKLIIINN
jgi:hypothetical protein